MFDDYKNKYKNNRCFIVGSGNSLQKEKLNVLKNEKIFIVNRSYKALDIGLPHYDFYVNVDHRIYETYSDEIQKNTKFPRFYNPNFLNTNAYWDGPREKFIPVFKHSSKDDPKCRGIINGIMPNSFEVGWGKTGTVIIDAILIAFFLGFKKIYLLGVDLNVNSGKSTHFYGDENRLRNYIKKTNKEDFISMDLLKIISNIIKFSNYLKVEIVNLSSGYERKDLFRVDSLKNLFS